MSPEQLFGVLSWLKSLGAIVVHHGDNAGADEQIHRLADRMSLWRVVHPSSDRPDQAHFLGDGIFPARPHATAIKDIVDATYVLITAPDSQRYEGSDIDEAIRYAASEAKLVVVIGPDGKILWSSPGLSGGPARAQG